MALAMIILAIVYLFEYLREERITLLIPSGVFLLFSIVFLKYGVRK